MGVIPTLTRNCEFDSKLNRSARSSPRTRPRGRDRSILASAFSCIRDGAPKDEIGGVRAEISIIKKSFSLRLVLN
ncbi:hypothetical protein [Leptospira kirschneri]|uniref:hypothetical protein n=1 Tax=Leptospira kirschneri TaxID=29507 RepID=UPI00034C5139|nr:hypothetical protein [Leptospira kirschneri]